jgi:hypothetical protein
MKHPGLKRSGHQPAIDYTAREAGKQREEGFILSSAFFVGHPAALIAFFLLLTAAGFKPQDVIKASHLKNLLGLRS